MVLETAKRHILGSKKSVGEQSLGSFGDLAIASRVSSKVSVGSSGGSITTDEYGNSVKRASLKGVSKGGTVKDRIIIARCFSAAARLQLVHFLCPVKNKQILLLRSCTRSAAPRNVVQLWFGAFGKRY